MNEKRSAVFTIAVISAVILIFTAADLIQGDRVFSETENRVLASRAKFTVESLLNGTYTENYETYITDQFVSRDKWIAIKTFTDMALGREEIKGVYLGKDGYLIEQHLPEDYPQEKAEEKIALLQKLAEKWDAKVMLVPTADNILADKLPANAPCYDESWLLARVEEAVGPDRYIDVYEALQEHAGEQIYYRTDHHWTSLGAYYGYLAWEEVWEKQLDREREEDKTLREQEKAADKKERYAGKSGTSLSRSRMRADDTDVWDGKGDRYGGRDALVTVTEEFQGTLHSKINISVEPDSIQYFPETRNGLAKVTYDLRQTADSCYEESYLDTKNKYGFFMDDNHAMVELETDYHNGKTLFVIKDSYANCFVPMLIPYYEKIYVMDLRYFNGRLFRYMESCEPEEDMDVLVLYNCIHFLEEFAYTE